MPQINLLPWREEQRQQYQRKFLQRVLWSILVGIILIIASEQLVRYQLFLQSARNTLIKNHTTQLDNEIEEVRVLQKTRDQLLHWINIVDARQAERGHVVQIFNNLAQAVNTSVYLTKAQQREQILILEGEAQSNREISELMRTLARIENLHKPSLTDVRTSSIDSNFNHFTLQLQSINPTQKQRAP